MSSRAMMVAACVACALRVTHAQDAAVSAHPLFVNGEWERYARIRQVIGDAPPYPWSIRAFGVREQDSVSHSTRAHPWQSRDSVRSIRVGIAEVTAVPVDARAIYNSDFPFGYNDGPVWAGRGLTTGASGGIIARAGVVSLALVPMLFRAENRAYAIRPTGLPGAVAFGDAFEPAVIDQPQRFGDRAYQRLDPGNSTLRVDAFGIGAGVSTANQHWGPARDHPLILGNNAAGFPHVFLGTSRPVDVYIARLHGRLLWGRPDASPFSPAGPAERYRFASGIAALVQPRGVPGLELGLARFFHQRWEPGVVNWENISRPFIGIVRNFRRRPGDPIGDEPDNQIASLFGRWALPASGFEVYGEFAKDDYNQDFRDLAMEPDHLSGYMLGVQRVTRRDSSRYTVLRGEVLNTRISPLATSRPQYRFYIHTRVLQGHTNVGQVLGSAAAFGGGAAVLAMDRYSEQGRTSVTWSRMFRAENIQPSGIADRRRADIFQILTLDGVRFRGRFALTYELTGILELNRHFDRDAFSARLATGAQFAW